MLPKTIFLDIDGTLLKHFGHGYMQANIYPEVLPGVLSKIEEWDKKGYNIILVTGRRESERHKTEQQLSDVGMVYDQLIMGIGGGTRVMINDTKPDKNEDTAVAITVVRNNGLEDIDI